MVVVPRHASAGGVPLDWQQLVTYLPAESQKLAGNDSTRWSFITQARSLHTCLCHLRVDGNVFTKNTLAVPSRFAVTNASFL